MAENNSITKDTLINALNERIVNDFREGFAEELQKLLDNPDELSQKHNRVFVHNVRNVVLTDELLTDIRLALLNDFGFGSDDIKDIKLSSDDNPCIMVVFTLLN